MRQVNKEIQSGIDEQHDKSETSQAKGQWARTILLNLIMATTVCMARAAMDYLLEGYNNSPIHRGEDYSKGEYPF